MNEEAREQAIYSALSDSSSEYYKALCRALSDAVARDMQAKASGAKVVIPFYIPDAGVVALEKQFGVNVVVKGALMRARLTPRVAGMLVLLDAALLEHAGGSGREVLVIDGDVVTTAIVGMENRIVERTNAHSRLAFGYFSEDECLRVMVGKERVAVASVARCMLREIEAGGGSHFFPSVRIDGPRVDSIVFNHFKTPGGLNQLAELVMERGGVLYGAFPFEMEMLTREKGRLSCFPGWFYVDRELDMVTLVPDEDACMSVSHPYGPLMEIVRTGCFTHEGVEYVCEKYARVPGVMYYTLTKVEVEYETPETLRSFLFDSSLVGVTRISYPAVKLSQEGVPVGYERGEVNVLTSRLDKVLARAATSTSAVVTPAEVFTMFMDYNNMIINTLDTAVVAERMDYREEEQAALAVALHINWNRAAARGSLNSLLQTVKMRYACGEIGMHKFAMLALSAWWQRPEITESMSSSGEIPVPRVLDWCGNDFSVVMHDVDPWVVMKSVSAQGTQVVGTQYSFLPGFRRSTFKKGKSEVKKDLWHSTGVEESSRASKQFSLWERKGVNVKTACAGPSDVVVTTTYAVEERKEVVQAERELTDLKKRLKDKLVAEQGAVEERPATFVTSRLHVGVPDSIPVVPVPMVDVVSAIQDDLVMLVGGAPERDMVKTGYRLAEAEERRTTRGVMEINDSKRNIPKGRYIRRPKVDVGVEGVRVPSQSALMGAAFKRQVGIPNSRGVVDIDEFPTMAVQRMINVCFKSDWMDTVEKHLNTGMWQPNGPDIDEFVAGLDERKVNKMLSEFFSEGDVTLDSWLYMAKGKVKPSREEGYESKVNHAQTIMYLDSSSTNALYSAMVKRFKLCLDECIVDEVKLNPQWNAEESEQWYNEREPVRAGLARVYSYSVDQSVFDRSQEHTCLRPELELYRRMGLNRDTLHLWERTHGKKKAASMMFGVVITMVLGGISGIFKTLLRNGLITLIGITVATGIQRGDIVSLRIKGDDVDAEFSRPVNVETAVERMSLSFNLNAKFNTMNVRYFCKEFMVKILDRWIQIADPWPRIQAACTPIVVGDSRASMEERWISLCSDLRNYDNELAVSAAAEAAQIYYGCARPLYGFARSLSTFKAEQKVYMGFFNPPEWID